MTSGDIRTAPMSSAEWKRLALVGILTALVGATVAYLFLWLRAPGDEPPIRVSGGSIVMDLIHKQKRFHKANPSSNKQWKIQGARRGNNRYLVHVGPSQGHTCEQGYVFVGERVEFVHSDEKTVVFDSTDHPADNETTISSGEDLEVVANSDDRKLAYARPGHIKQIKIDGTAVCDFGEGQLQSVMITEEP